MCAMCVGFFFLRVGKNKIIYGCQFSNYMFNSLFQYFHLCSNVLLKKCIPERTPMSRNIAIFCFENMHQESTTNRTRWHTNEQHIVVWRRLGAVWGGLGAQRARKPTRMHFRMRKPRSWLTLGGCFLVQFWCFFVFFFVVFSSLRPERYFIDFYAILSLFSTPFLEFFGARWK